MKYYNTTKETDTLTDSINKATKQDKKILLLFKKYKTLGASDIFKMWHDSKTPITSIRRSINTLMNDNKILMLETRQKSYYGRLEYVYKIIE